MVKNPVAYMLNFDYNADMLGELLLRLQGVQTGATRDAGAWEAIDSVDEDGNALPVRRNLIAYAATLYQNCAKPGTLPAIETEPYIDAWGAARERCTNPRALLGAMLAATPADSSYSLNWENLRRLGELAAYCAENGIELTFVLPPIDDALRQYLVAPLGLDEPMRTIRQALADTGAAVRDFEVEPEAVYAEEQYYDGFHLDVERGLPEFTRALFGAKEA